MKLYPEERETIGGVSAALRAGETSCADILKSCLANIERWEPQVHAWVYLDLDGANEQAQRLDAEIAEGKFRGPLHGIPIGIKDIIDVAGMPTGCGSRLWKDRIAERDARFVVELRNAGAIILGKTVTTAYAWIDPPVTRNPWNLERTPGGSSSGSAAAVATGMCLGAIGTQTGGSIIRPAAFCGVTGMVPSNGGWSCATEGVMPFAPSFDRVGPIARSVGDLAILCRAMFDPRELDDGGLSTIGVVEGPFWDRAEPSMRRAFDRAIEAMEAAGAVVITAGESLDFDRIVRAHRTIMATEAAAYHRDRLRNHPDDYPPRIRSLIEEGLAVSGIEYVQAHQLHHGACDLEGLGMRDEYSDLDGLLNQVDVLATPAAIGPAPDLTTTGDPSFQSPWSFLLHLPVVTFPIGLSPEGLPLGIQLVGKLAQDRTLLAAAIRCERVLRDALNPGGG